jgi:hypothetical protein
LKVTIKGLSFTQFLSVLNILNFGVIISISLELIVLSQAIVLIHFGTETLYFAPIGNPCSGLN